MNWYYWQKPRAAAPVFWFQDDGSPAVSAAGLIWLCGLCAFQCWTGFSSAADGRWHWFYVPRHKKNDSMRLGIFPEQIWASYPKSALNYWILFLLNKWKALGRTRQYTANVLSGPRPLHAAPALNFLQAPAVQYCGQYSGGNRLHRVFLRCIFASKRLPSRAYWDWKSSMAAAENTVLSAGGTVQAGQFGSRGKAKCRIDAAAASIVRGASQYIALRRYRKHGFHLRQTPWCIHSKIADAAAYFFSRCFYCLSNSMELCGSNCKNIWPAVFILVKAVWIIRTVLHTQYKFCCWIATFTTSCSWFYLQNAV